ncbi:MAG: four helix bundle protein [Patescibacteria group bacterium]
MGEFRVQSEELRIGIAERSIEFAVRIIPMVNSIPKTPAGYAIASQIVRSGTSIGANLQEAQSASSKKDFIHCVNIALKEARETYYWLTLLSRSQLIPPKKLCLLLKENDEIIRILVTIVKKSRNNSALLTRNS